MQVWTNLPDIYLHISRQVYRKILSADWTIGSNLGDCCPLRIPWRCISDEVYKRPLSFTTESRNQCHWIHSGRTAPINLKMFHCPHRIRVQCNILGSYSQIISESFPCFPCHNQVWKSPCEG